MWRVTENLIYYYEEIFKIICKDLDLDLEFNINVNFYTEEECEIIVKELKMKYPLIWEEVY